MNTRIIVKVLVTVLFGISSICLAVEETWTKKASMPTARVFLSTSVVNGKIYAIGGLPNPYSPYSVVEEYDPVTDTWTGKADMPTARGILGTCVVDGKIYAIGGVRTHTGPAFPTVEEYDPATDTWTSKSDMPTARGMLSVSAVNGKIYAFGGARSTHGPVLSTVEEYDPATDTWTRKTDLPETKYYHSTSVVNGKIYIIAGAPREGIASRTMYEYDPLSDIYTRKADLLTATAMLSTSVVNGMIYAIGGDPHVMEKYDPVSDTWTKKANMLTPRALLSTSSVNGKIYAIGGSRTVPGTSLSTVEEYDTGLTASQPDFNGNGVVDIKDLLKVIEYWGQDVPIFDIAPPFGDGLIDVLDLELLMSYWKQPVDDPTLIAHWAMDEVEGDTAYDSAGTNDALVIGDPAWLPSDGQVQGALQLDGIDDCVIANSVLNPANGPFSVFAWIKGNTPGQVIISGPMSANWLSIDALTGNLMTELKGTGRSGVPLQSQTAVTDGIWHRIGFVWNGVNRTLYVDDFVVAEDTQNGLESSNDGLYIGCDKNMEPDTYWSGLIDDIRIYNRAIIP